MAPGQAYQPLARTEIARLRKSLDSLFERAFDLDPSAETAGDINRYVCIRVSGFLEQVLLSLGRSVAERMSGGISRDFGLSWLNRAPNPSSAEVIRFVQRFSNAWGAELRALLADDERGERLNALVGIRNDIAHGKNQGLSAVQAFGYYEVVTEVAEWLADRLEPKAGMQPASKP